MKIKKIDVQIIKENPENPRNIEKERLKKLIKSIKDFPRMLEIRPVVVNQDFIVLAGNMRLRAAKEIGLHDIPVLFVEDLTLEEQKEFIIKDNIGYGEWDFLKLEADWDVQLLEEWGLEFDFKKEEKEIIEDEKSTAEAEEIETSIIEGDLIEIGRHRLICGDSTHVDIVEKLLANQEPYLMITDPPYGVNYDPGWRNERKFSSGSSQRGRAVLKVDNDDKTNWREAYSLSPAKVAYVYHAGLNGAQFFQDLESCEYIVRNQIIWVKNHFAIGRGDYQQKHEPCWYAVKKGASSEWLGERHQTTVWEIDKNQRNDTGHSTQKPIECMLMPMRNHRGDIYDPFLGSGTTMVAAEQLGRICYGIEINPKYCQIIINRMLKIDPTIPVKINGIDYHP